MPDRIFQNLAVLQGQFGRGMMQTLIDFMADIFMNKRYSIAQLYFIIFPIFIEPPGETIAVRIDILVGWIITRIIPDEKISMFSDRIIPR